MLAIGVGTAFGLSQHQEGTPRVVAYALALGAPWLIAAILTASIARSALVAAGVAATLLGSGTIAHYAFMATTGAGGYAFEAATVWLGSAIAAGALIGLLAFYARRFLMAIIGALMLGEAAVLAVEWTREPGRVVVVSEALIGAGLIAWAVMSRGRKVLLVAVGVLAAAIVGESVVRDLARSSGWRGA